MEKNLAEARQEVALRHGIDQEVGKKIVKLIKDSKIKVQAGIHGDKVRVTGKKTTAKVYTSFSGYVGGHKSETFEKRQARRPELLVERAVRGMIPHNRLGRAQFTKLKVYAGAEHPHSAQQPKELKIP